MNTGATEPFSWSPVWVAPLVTAVPDTSTGLVSAILTQSLKEAGLDAEAAPREITEDLAARPVVLFVSLTKWEVKRTLTGWTAVANVCTEANPLGDLADRMRIEITSTVSAAGKYSGWVKRSTVERHLAEQLAQKVTEGISKNLKSYLTLAETNENEDDKRVFGLSFSFRRSSVTRKGEQLVQGVQHDLLLPNAKVDYYWSLPEQTLLVYRVVATGEDIEKELLVRLGNKLPPPGGFMDSAQQRRRLFEPRISHWDPYSPEQRVPQSKLTERLVVVIVDNK